MLFCFSKLLKKKHFNNLYFLEYCKVEDLDGGEVKFIREGFEKRVSSCYFCKYN